MNKEELLALVKILMSGGKDETTGKRYSEAEYHKLVRYFEVNIVNKKGSDLIFYPDLCGLRKDATAEEIVEAALHE